MYVRIRTIQFANSHRWNPGMKFSYFFAVKYQQSFVYFGIPSNKTKADTEEFKCTMGGFIATLVVDREDGYIWSNMPELNLQLKRIGNVRGGVQLYGGYVCGDQIEMLGRINTPKPCGSRVVSYKNESTDKSWVISLTDLSKWSESIPDPTYWDEELMAVQQCQQYIVYFYSNNTLKIISKEKAQNPHTFQARPNAKKFNRYINFTIFDNDMFILNENTMAKIENFQKLLDVDEHELLKKRLNEVNFNLTVKHANGTLFAVEDALCVVGGCDGDYEPYCNIYQFDQSKKEWNQCGYSTVSRFGASAVVFNGGNGEDTVFVAGGFKGKDDPCSVIEKMTVEEVIY